MKINVVEAPMGAGKTSAAISYMNRYVGDKRKRFMFITPYLTECERVIESCAGLYFTAPKETPTKTADLKRLLQHRRNIVSTHKLFTMFDDGVIDLLNANDYVLILDEAVSVFDEYEMTSDDISVILDRYAHIDSNGLLVWDDWSYAGEFEGHMYCSKIGSIGLYGDKHVPFWMLPVSTFKAFRDVFVLTYMFETQMQRYYFDMWGMQYNYMTVRKVGEEYEFVPGCVQCDTSMYADLIHIVQNDKLNSIGRDSRSMYDPSSFSLSKGWYQRNAGGALMQQLKSNAVNFFIHYSKTPSKLNMWTTYSDYKNELKGKGYTKGFVPLNMRATNAYMHKTAIAYLVNLFPNPVYRNFMLSRGVQVDADAWATSNMVQFIFRSAVRVGKDVQVYVPSARMRYLLQKWLGICTNEETEWVI